MIQSDHPSRQRAELVMQFLDPGQTGPFPAEVRAIFDCDGGSVLGDASAQSVPLSSPASANHRLMIRHKIFFCTSVVPP
jgi:hypothetical protein